MGKSIRLNNVKIFTSYFDNKEKLLNLGYKNLVSIAGKCPNDFVSTRLNDNRCWEYKKLAPKYNWWKEWHDNHLSNEWYIKKYYETVLNKLNQYDVLTELNRNDNDIILLCWETPNLFCHRHIISDWFKKAGFNCNEIEVNK